MAGRAPRRVGGARYHGVAIALHWSIAALVILNLLSALLIPALFPTHKAVGITVLALSVLRWLWRLGHRMPPPPRDIPRWQQLAARANHLAFYILLLALPLTGWVMVSATERRRPLSWFGLFDIPYLPLAPSPAGARAHDAHVTLGLLMAALVVLHVAAALRHQFVLRDRLLGRMGVGSV